MNDLSDNLEHGEDQDETRFHQPANDAVAERDPDETAAGVVSAESESELRFGVAPQKTH